MEIRLYTWVSQWQSLLSENADDCVEDDSENEAAKADKDMEDKGKGKAERGRTLTEEEGAVVGASERARRSHCPCTSNNDLQGLHETKQCWSISSPG